MSPVKINAVLMRGQNDHQAVDLVTWAVERGVELRFIEQMPLDAGHTWERGDMVTRAEVMAALEQRFTLTPLPGRGAAPAERFDLKHSPGGMIDIEFAVQYLVLAHSHQHPALIENKGNIELLRRAASAGLIPPEAGKAVRESIERMHREG